MSTPNGQQQQQNSSSALEQQQQQCQLQQYQQSADNDCVVGTPAAVAVGSGSQDNLKEFHEFLRRVRTLQMSGGDASSGGSYPNQTIQTTTNNGGVISNSSPMISNNGIDNNNNSSNCRCDSMVLSPENIVKGDLNNIEVGVEPTLAMEDNDDEMDVEQSQNIIKQQSQQQQQPLTNIRVTVGIDKDLEMILEMDPSIVDLVDVPAVEEPRIIGLPPLAGGPTFKTATPTSRTQLKLQLQREQQQQELERREAEKRAIAVQESTMGMDTSQHHMQQQMRQQQQYSHQQSTHMQPMLSPYLNNSSPMQHSQLGRESTTPTLKVPLQSIGVDVPPQVLQVRTVLENPTRYHVIQKQKSQVRQFISESLKQSGEWDEQIFHQNGKSSIASPSSTTNLRPGNISFADQQHRQDNNCSPMTNRTGRDDNNSIGMQSSPFSVGNFSASASIGDTNSVSNKGFSGNGFNSSSGFKNSNNNLAVSNNSGNVSSKVMGSHCKSMCGSSDRVMNNFGRGGSGASHFSGNMTITTTNASPGASAGGMSPSLSSVATSNSELKNDVEEITVLLPQCTREHIKNVLLVEKHKLETEILNSEMKAKSEAGKAGAKPAKPEKPTPKRYLIELNEYAWDQSDRFVKMFITLDGVQNLTEESVNTTFTEKTMLFHVSNLNNKDYGLTINNLLYPIDIEKSYRKIKKSGMVAVYMKKKDEGKTWSHLTKIEKRLADKQDADMEDVLTGDDAIVKLMKRMFQTGDAATKQMIAKAWTENQEEMMRKDE